MTFFSNLPQIPQLCPLTRRAKFALYATAMAAGAIGLIVSLLEQHRTSEHSNQSTQELGTNVTVILGCQLALAVGEFCKGLAIPADVFDNCTSGGNTYFDFQQCFDLACSKPTTFFPIDALNVTVSEECSSIESKANAWYYVGAVLPAVALAGGAIGVGYQVAKQFVDSANSRKPNSSPLLGS